MTARPAVHRALIGAAIWLALLIVTQFLLPGGDGGSGTPVAVLVSGAIRGLLTALTAVALVVVYRSTRVINFAQTAIGAAGAELTFQLLQLTSTPWYVAIALGVAVAGMAGLVFDLTVGRRFFRAPRVVLTTATIAVAALLASVSRDLVNALPFFPRESDRTVDQLAGSTQLRRLLPLADWHFTIGSVRLPFGFAEVLAAGVALAAILGVVVFMRSTALGTSLRAMAENLDRTSLLGISTGALSSVVWTLAGVLSGIGLILTGILSAPSAAAGTAPRILLPALAAAVIARMTSIPVAALAAVGLEMLRAAFNWSFPSDAALFDVFVFVVIGAGLLLQRPRLARSEDTGGVSWDATDEQRQIPRELRAIPGIRLTRWALIATAVAAAVIYPHVVSVGSVLLGGVIAMSAILALSVLVLTGWAGQVSLGQYGFAAVGGVLAAALTGTVGLTFWLAVPLATAFTAGFAALVGVPALRIRGLFLAASTFAFAVAVHAVLFNQRYFGWLLPDRVERPTFLLLDFDDETSMYYLCLAALVGAVVVVGNLRRSRSGRMLIAVRENEANLQTFAISALRAKLVAFAVSGALAGFAGAMLVHLLRGTAASSFEPSRSVELFLLAVLGGVSSVPGVVLGALVFNINNFFLTDNVVFGAVEPFLVILLLFIEPAGLIGLVNRARDGVLRIVAQRRQLIVPSLFADRDVDDLESRLLPLAPPLGSGGLAALAPDERFVLASELYAGAGKRRAATAPSREAALIGAAAGAAAEEEAR